jgi:hypothetical protein
MLASVTLLTKLDTFRFSTLDKNPLPYTRVLGVTAGTERVVVLRDETPEDEWSLDLPSDFAERLFTAMKCIKSGEPMNCHRFSRIVAGVQSPRFTSDDESYAISDIHEKNRVITLGLGELGLVGSEAEINGARHSLIGLGEDVDYSIQVMSAQGDVGIARYDDVLNLYRGSWPNERSADLYKVE